MKSHKNIVGTTTMQYKKNCRRDGNWGKKYLRGKDDVVCVRQVFLVKLLV
jgi:hypothetical protein